VNWNYALVKAPVPVFLPGPSPGWSENGSQRGAFIARTTSPGTSLPLGYLVNCSAIRRRLRLLGSLCRPRKGVNANLAAPYFGHLSIAAHLLRGADRGEIAHIARGTDQSDFPAGSDNPSFVILHDTSLDWRVIAIPFPFGVERVVGQKRT
jgi:hypothetical protein